MFAWRGGWMLYSEIIPIIAIICIVWRYSTWYSILDTWYWIRVLGTALETGRDVGWRSRHVRVIVQAFWPGAGLGKVGQSASVQGRENEFEVGGQNMCFYTMQKMPEFCFIILNVKTISMVCNVFVVCQIGFCIIAFLWVEDRCKTGWCTIAAFISVSYTHLTLPTIYSV